MDDDLELARALALSAREAAKPSTRGWPREVIDLNSDNEEDLASFQRAAKSSRRPVEVIDLNSDNDDADDEDARFQAELERALEASKADMGGTSEKSRVDEPPISEPPSIMSGTSAFLSERAQLERERRERQKRLRKQAGLDDDDDNGDNNKDGEGGDEERRAKRQHVSSSSALRSTGNADPVSAPSRSSTVPQSVQSVQTSDQLFWEGELRPIANIHADPRKDGKPTFRLTEILGKKSDLSFAIISSYVLMLSWIYEFFDPSVPVIVVGHPDASGKESLHNALPNWIKTTPFLRGGIGCMHMKFMLLFYKTGRLRVVVSTANLVDYDYRDIENAAWLQDVPLRPTPILHDPKVVDDFPSVMQRVLRALHVRPALTTMLKNDHRNLPIQSVDDLRIRWDWSKVKAHLVPSIAGRHEGWPNVLLTGHPKLMKVVRSMGMRTGKAKGRKDLVLECQGSSLGGYTTQWMNEFHWSARGESAEDWLDEPKKRREKQPYPPVKVVFPTKRTVQESKLGESGGGTIFCRRAQWAAKNFPRDNFYSSKSKAGNVLMHSKMIIGLFKDQATAHGKGKGRATLDDDSDTEDDDEIEEVEPGIGWAYVGSHNFTPSAWGMLSGSAFNPVLNVRNYELGVVFPLKDEEAVEAVACWERPPQKYVLGKDEPWIQEESVYFQS